MMHLRVSAIVACVACSFACNALLGTDFEARSRSEGPDAQAETDAQTAPDAHTGEPFCINVSPEPFFCSDFDGDDVRKGWASEGVNPDLTLTNGGRLSADSSLFVSPTNSVSFILPALATADDSATASLIKQLPATAQKAILAFKVRFEAVALLGDDSAVVVASFTLGKVAFIALALDKKGPLLLVSDLSARTQNRAYFQKGLVKGKWQEVSMLLQNLPTTASEGKVTALLDGEPVSLPLTAAFQGQRATVAIGPGASFGPSQAFQVNIDNVLVTLPK